MASKKKPVAKKAAKPAAKKKPVEAVVEPAKPTNANNRKGVHWRKAETDELVLMYTTGVDLKTICRTLNRPKKSVESKIYRLALKRPEETKEPEVVPVVMIQQEPEKITFWQAWKRIFGI